MTSRSYPDSILIIGNNRSYILKQACIYQFTLPCPWIITYQTFGRSQPKNTILIHRGVIDSVLSLINRPESPFRRIILTNILQIGKVCLCTFRSYYQWRMTLVLFSHSSHYIKLSGDHIIYKNMLGTEKNFSLRYPLDIDRKTIDMRVWERGSGETFACGTGACASVVACVLNGLTDNEVTVHLLGGDLQIRYAQDEDTVYMTGPATTVCTGEIDI